MVAEFSGVTVSNGVLWLSSHLKSVLAVKLSPSGVEE